MRQSNEFEMTESSIQTLNLPENCLILGNFEQEIILNGLSGVLFMAKLSFLLVGFTLYHSIPCSSLLSYRQNLFHFSSFTYLPSASK
jgi:hypothetical protein